jgi:PAS domain S-box-containing protein
LFGWFGRLRFRVQILIFMFTIVLLSLGVSALIVFPKSRQAQYDIKLDRLLSTGQLKQTWVEQQLRETRERVRTAARSDLTLSALVRISNALDHAEQEAGPGIRPALRGHFGADDRSTAATQSALATAAESGAKFAEELDLFGPLIREQVSAFELDDLLLIRAADGLIVHSTRRGREFLQVITDPAIAPHVRRCAERVRAAPGTPESPALIFEDFAVRPGVADGRVACLGAPLFGEGAVIGVLVALLPITPLNSIMLEQSETAGAITTCLVGGDSLIRSGRRAGGRAPGAPVDHAGVRAALQGRSGHGIVADADGTRRLAVWFPVPVDDDMGYWALLAEMDESDVYAVINRNTLQLTMWWSVMLVLLMAMAFVFSRRVDRAVRALSRRTHEVAAGLNPAPLARGESSREFTALADSFNAMAERVRERAIAAERAQRAAVEQREALLRASDERLRRQNAALVALAKVEPQHGPHEGQCVRDVTRTAAETLEAARASVWFFDESGEKLRCMQLHDRQDCCYECGMELAVADYPEYFAALAAERIIAADDAWSDPRTRELAESYLRPKGIRSMLDAAIQAGGRTIGVVCFEHVGDPRTWQLDEQTFASALADLVALLKESMERDRAEAELAESRERLALTFTATNDAIWDLDLATDRLIVNPRFYELCDIQPEEVTRAGWRERVHPDDRAGLEAAISDHLSGQSPALMHEFRQRARGGEYIWVAMRGRAVSRAVDGKPLRVVGTQTDVTDRRRAAAAEAERAAADEANRAKSQFLANMSHELRTPLNGVLGYAQILQRDSAMGPKQRECLEAIESCGQHLLTLINDVLDLSKIEAGRMEVRNEPCDLPRLLTDVGHVVRQRAEAKGLRFDLLMSPHVPRGVLTDPTKLRQVLVNLLGNAVKFTEHGNVTMSIGPDSHDRLRFAVTDTGIGIPPARQAEIFDAFKQTEAGAAAGGTGLGLAISRKIVQALGGELAVESEIGRGSTFYFTLPLYVADSTQLAGADGAAESDRRDVRLAPGQRVRVLIADDRAANRDILVKLLTNAGFDTLECENGQQAVDLTRRERPNLVFMDVRMPVLDGLSATRMLRRDPELKDVPVIAVTASVFPDAQRQARAAGCNDIIGKPFRAGEVFTRIEQHLGVTFIAPDSAGSDMREPAEAGRPALTPAEAARLAQRLRSAAEIGSITELSALAGALRATGGAAAAYASLIERHARSFDFEALAGLAAELETGAHSNAET